MPERIGITSPLRRVWTWALLAGIYSSLAMFKSFPPLMFVPPIPSGLDAALSFAMALLIAFRINRAYERWWEARSLWGSLVNASRNLAVKVRELHPLSREDRQSISDLIVAFAMGLKDHLRDDARLARLPGFENVTIQPGHVPSYIAQRIYQWFYRWINEGTLSDPQLWVLDSEARILLNVCGGCEKIKTTLMSVSWRYFTWQCIFIYLLVLPWGLVDDFDLWTIPLTILVAYVVMAGEGIAHYVEQPFGVQEDHLDLERICQTIDSSVSEVLVGR